MCQLRAGLGASRTQEFRLPGAQGPSTSFLCSVPTPALRLLCEKLDNKERGRGMLGAAINRGCSQEGREDGQQGLPGQGPNEGGLLKEGPGTPKGSDSRVNRGGGGVNPAGVEWGLGEDAVSRAGTQETLWLQR